MIVKYMLNYQTPLDLAFQALADPTRRAIVERLAEKPASVSELKRAARYVAAGGDAASGGAGDLGACRSQSRAACGPAASIRPRSPEAERWITERRLEWERRLDRLGDYLKTLESEGKIDEQDR